MDTENNSWPMLLDMTKEECKQSLRALELSTYSKIVSVLRAQGELTKEKRKLLSELQSVFSIPLERHRAEVRRAVNDEILNTVAERLAGPNTGVEWAIEGRRLIPLMPRVPPQVAYTALATRMAQMYCGLNANMPRPSETGMYRKLYDLGAESEGTESEDETDGLRFIPGTMIPQQFNSDQGSFTTLPQSQLRIQIEKLKEKEALERKREREMMEISQKLQEDDNGTFSDDSASSPLSTSGSTPVTSSPSAQTTSSGPLVGAEKRKRKRSLSTDDAPPNPPPPPPAPIAPGVTQASALLGTQHAIAPLRQVPSMASAPSMKITVTGGISRSSSMQSTAVNSHSPKVILVSTSSASSQGGNIYPRSISVPILKPPLQNSGATQGGVLKGVPPSVSSTAVLSGGSQFVAKLRPRFSSMASSILSQGSSSLPGLPSVQRSNSLILQNDGSFIPNIAARKETIVTRSSSVAGQTMLPDSSSGNSLNFIGSNNLRGGTTLVPGKSIHHIKPDGGNNGGSSNMMSSRIIGRSTLASSGNQGLYVVSTTSGTITVVTRTVASGCITTPRVVTVNTINNSKTPLVRGPSPATILSAPGLRPVLGGAKSNVIVVHKGAMQRGVQSVGAQGVRDISAKIITKSLTPSGSNGGNGPQQGLLSGTLVVKPSTSGKTLTCVGSSTNENNIAPVSSTIISSSNNPSEITSGNSSVILVDFNNSSSLISGSQNSTTTTTIASVSNLPQTTFSGTSSISSVSEIRSSLSESIEKQTENSSSESIEKQTENSVCESSTLPTVSAQPQEDINLADTKESGEEVDEELPSSSEKDASKDEVEIEHPQPQNQITSSTSCLPLHLEDDTEATNEEDLKPTSSSLPISDWLKARSSSISSDSDSTKYDNDDDSKMEDLTLKESDGCPSNEASTSKLVTEEKLPDDVIKKNENVMTAESSDRLTELEKLVEKTEEDLRDDEKRSPLRAGFQLIDSTNEANQSEILPLSSLNESGVSSSSGCEEAISSPSFAPIAPESLDAEMSGLADNLSNEDEGSNDRNVELLSEAMDEVPAREFEESN